MNGALYGDIASLTNGCLLRVVDETGAPLLDFTDGYTIQQNSDWSNLVGADARMDIILTANWTMGVRFTIARAGYHMRLKSGWSVEFQVRDNLAGLVRHRIMAQGVLIARSRQWSGPSSPS
jgi:hypothetical protein